MGVPVEVGLPDEAIRRCQGGLRWPRFSLSAGLLYLVAVMDRRSRHVLSWWLSTTVDTGLCVEVLEAALLDGYAGHVQHRPECAGYERGVYRAGPGGPGGGAGCSPLAERGHSRDGK